VKAFLRRHGHRFLRFVRFAIVGASGIVINELALAAFVTGFGLHYVVGVLLSTQVSTSWNFALFEVWALRSESYRNKRWQRWAMLMAVNNIANVATLPILIFFTSVLGVNYLISNLITLVIVILARFALADQIWAPRRHQPRTALLQELQHAIHDVETTLQSATSAGS
jgi:putative flippase GtrA